MRSVFEIVAEPNRSVILRLLVSVSRVDWPDRAATPYAATDRLKTQLTYFDALVSRPSVRRQPVGIEPGIRA
jgi:hypothetical protein